MIQEWYYICKLVGKKKTPKNDVKVTFQYPKIKVCPRKFCPFSLNRSGEEATQPVPRAVSAVGQLHAPGANGSLDEAPESESPTWLMKSANT